MSVIIQYVIGRNSISTKQIIQNKTLRKFCQQTWVKHTSIRLAYNVGKILGRLVICGTH